MNKMTREEAGNYIRSCGESDGPETYEEAAAIFAAMIGRSPTSDDGDQGELWSHACAADTDPLHGYDPSEIIVGPGGQTLADAAAAAVRLTTGERVERVTPGVDERYTVRTAAGVRLVCLGGMPDGYHVGDYFRDDVYLGPDCDGVEPYWEAVAAAAEVAAARSHAESDAIHARSAK